jgi:hypothetical protein
MMTFELSTQALSALRAKYQRMLEMRQLHDAGVAHDPRPEMRTLAAQFPGALRELDELPLATITQRIAQLGAVIDQQAPVAPWMVWMVEYHGYWRAALRIRRMGLPRADLSTALAQLRGRYVAAHDEPALETFEAETLAAVLKPAHGRLGAWVLSRIADAHGVTSAAIHAQLFPAGRPLRHP